MLSVTALACLAIGLFAGYAVAARVTEKQAHSSSKNASATEAASTTAPSAAAGDTEKILRQDPVFEEMKVVLIGLLTTLDTAIAHLQEGSEKYAEQLDTHRYQLKKTLTLDDLKHLGAELVHQVETMYTSNARYRNRLQEADGLVKKQQKDLETLQLKTGTDFLTNVANRSAYEDRIKEMMNISRRYGNIFSLLVLDIDHFKNVNDTHGHAAGDTILRDTASLLSKFSRASDFLARYGGEEFANILPETKSDRAAVVGEKFRKLIVSNKFSYADSEIAITISCGVGTVKPGKETSEDSFARVDAALYKAKELGRNRVELSEFEAS